MKNLILAAVFVPYWTLASITAKMPEKCVCNGAQIALACPQIFVACHDESKPIPPNWHK